MKQLGVPRNFRHYMIFLSQKKGMYIHLSYSQISALIDSAYDDKCLDQPIMGAAIT